MKTVKEVSDELGVSQVTVYNHIKKINKEIKDNIKKIKGTTHINQEGINKLEVSMGLSDIPSVKETVSMENIVKDISSLVTENIKSDYEKIENNYCELKEQVELLKEQNERLINLVEEQQEKKGFIHKISNLFKNN